MCICGEGGVGCALNSVTEAQDTQFFGAGVTGSCKLSVWVLGIKLVSSARTVQAVNC